MELEPDYSQTQVVDDLATVMRNGVGRDLPTKASVPVLAAIAREMAPDPSLPLTQLIAEVVRPAIQRLFPEVRKQAAACLLDIDIDPAKTLDEIKIPAERKKLGGDRRPAVAKLLGWSDTSYDRDPAGHERPLLEDVAEQVLALLTAHREAKAATGQAEAPETAGTVSPATPDETEPDPAERRMRALMAAIGAVLALGGLAWLVAVATGALG